MEFSTESVPTDGRLVRIRAAICLVGLITSLVLLLLVLGQTQAQAEWPHVVLPKDGTPISYKVSGAKEPTLVFVHGWSCDARYWRAQPPYFAKNHRVVMLDLAGHGHSGMTRTKYTMRAFGEDFSSNRPTASRVDSIRYQMSQPVSTAR